jgi:hypothetical protein
MRLVVDKVALFFPLSVLPHQCFTLIGILILLDSISRTSGKNQETLKHINVAADTEEHWTENYFHSVLMD